MSHILVIDDEAGVRNVLRDVLEDEGYSVTLAEDGIQGLAALEESGADLVLLDVWLPHMGGIDVLKALKEKSRDTEVIVISGHANISMAVQAVKLGAFDFLEKPLSLDRTITVVRNALALEDLKKENRELRDTVFLEDRMIGESPPMQRVRELIDQSADTDSRILITGANGTGKELVARTIHMKSRRRNGPFVEVNCAAIPENLIESELFGHEKGAFTHALARRKGKFELAHQGTLFLDEIADMSLNTQSKVLRVLQEPRFERIGGETSISVDIRLIAATNKDIQDEIRAGRFREDLFFRLNVIPIHVPSLSERIEDLRELVGYFMTKFKRPNQPEPKRLDDGAWSALEEYPWPGNIRELKNFVERVNIMCDQPLITREQVDQYLGGTGRNDPGSRLDRYAEMKLGEARDEFERELIIEALGRHGNNISRTAQSLGIYPSSLHGKIKKLGISVDR